MKKFAALFFAVTLLASCGKTTSETEETVSQAVTLSETVTENEDISKQKQYIMLNGLLYENTGIISDVPRCGVLDGTFSEVIPENELPRKNGQANFNGSQGWQHSEEPLAIDVQIKDTWYVFREADIPYERDIDLGLSLRAENISPTGLTLVFEQSGGEGFSELITGQDHYLRRRTDNGWELCNTVIDSYGWTLVGTNIEPDKETRIDIDWEWLYGALPAGHYQISKVIVPDERYFDSCTFRTEFDIE